MLSYLYQYCFFAKLASSVELLSENKTQLPTPEKSDPFFDQEFLEEIQKLRESSAKEGESLQANINTILSENAEDEMPYYLKHFFDKRSNEDIDGDYIVQIGSAFPKYIEKTKEVVNQYTETFSYDQMDVLDQAIFLLGYTEHKTLDTPKEILINEMIELAKRYSDEGAPKLINGIMHKFLNAG